MEPFFIFEVTHLLAWSLSVKLRAHEFQESTLHYWFIDSVTGGHAVYVAAILFGRPLFRLRSR